MMALAFCDACEMKKIPLQSWCSSSSEDLAAHARDTRVEEMNLESSQGVGRERRRLNDDNTLAPRKDHRQPQLILRKLTVLDPTHLLKNTKFHVFNKNRCSFSFDCHFGNVDDAGPFVSFHGTTQSCPRSPIFYYNQEEICTRKESYSTHLDSLCEVDPNRFLFYKATKKIRISLEKMYFRKLHEVFFLGQSICIEYNS